MYEADIEASLSMGAAATEDLLAMVWLRLILLNSNPQARVHHRMLDAGELGYLQMSCSDHDTWHGASGVRSLLLCPSPLWRNDEKRHLVAGIPIDHEDRSHVVPKGKTPVVKTFPW